MRNGKENLMNIVKTHMDHLPEMLKKLVLVDDSNNLHQSSSCLHTIEGIVHFEIIFYMF